MTAGGRIGGAGVPPACVADILSACGEGVPPSCVADILSASSLFPDVSFFSSSLAKQEQRQEQQQHQQQKQQQQRQDAGRMPAAHAEKMSATREAKMASPHAGGTPASHPRRVLIVKPSSLGDVVTAMPVLRGIRRTFPQAHVSWLVARSCEDLIRHDSALDEVILFDRRHLGKAWRSPRAAWDLLALLRQLRRGKFDWVIDLQGLLRSALFAAATRAPVRCGFADAREGAAMFYSHAVRVTAQHTVQRNLELAATLGIDARPEDFTLEVSPEGKDFAREFLRDHNLRAKEFIVCVPPTRWPTKLYPVRHWRTVVGALAQLRTVVLVGAPGDRELCESILCGTGILPVCDAGVSPACAAGILPASSPSSPAKALAGLLEDTGLNIPTIFNLAGQTSVAQMVGLIAASGGVICSDSAAKFIAPAVGVNAIALLGPTRVESTGPYVPAPQVQAESVIAPVACQGCLKRRCRHCTCMELIEPKRVIDAAKRLFDLG